MSKREPGPNDFHVVNGVLMPGLGADEPDDLTKDEIMASAVENQKKEAALARAQAELEANASALDERATDLESRESSLAAREAALAAREKELDALTAPRKTTATQR